MAYLKPQSPLQDKKSGDYFYPLTTEDQVIMDNGSRLSGINFLGVDKNGATEGDISPVNADTLGGNLPEYYAIAENTVNKENIVNNFTTTEEGFVADARALKALRNELLSPCEHTTIQLTNAGVKMCRYGKLRVANIYITDNNSSTTTYGTLPEIDWPLNSVSSTQWCDVLANDTASNAYGTRSITINTSGVVSIDNTIYRANFILVYIAK